MDGKSPGSVLLVASASETVDRYQKAVNDWEWKLHRSVEVRSVDNANGCKADAVFFGLVEPSGFINDRIDCLVASRAIQGKIILIDYGIGTEVLSQSGLVAAEHPPQCWGVWKTSEQVLFKQVSDAETRRSCYVCFMRMRMS